MNSGTGREVLIVSPNRTDADLARAFLQEAGISAKTLLSLGDLAPLLKQHFGCLILVEECLIANGLEEFQRALDTQPPWSDVPLIFIASPETTLHGLLEAVFPNAGNISLLQRPLHPISFVSAARVALRARQRQFEVRNLLQQREDAVRKRDEFLAMLSHELRNPLAPLRNAAYILNTSPIADPTAAHAITLIDRQVQHLSRLVDDLLDVSRLENSKIELRTAPLDLNGAVSSAVLACSVMTDAAKQSVILRLAGDPLYVCADPVRIEQIFVNLIGNASKFTPSGGVITIETGSHGEMAHATVQDDGVGIALEKLGTIFELFEQGESSLARSAGGLGIGLTVVKRLMELHGGTIHAHSEGLGKGSRFVAGFPVVEGCSATIDPEPAAQGGGRARKRVLVVDDNADIRHSLTLLISMWDHEVEAAETGPDALSHALRYQPDVALIDIGLPGMDGFEVARRIRQSDQAWAKRAKLIALTGYGQPSDREKAMEAGFNLHLVKPVEPAALKELLDAATGVPSNAGGPSRASPSPINR